MCKVSYLSYSQFRHPPESFCTNLFVYCTGKALITNFLEREQLLQTNCRLKKTHLHSHKNSTFNLHVVLSSYRLFQGAEVTLVICFQVSIIQLFVIIIILIRGASPRNQNCFQLFFFSFLSFSFLSFFSFFFFFSFLILPE